MANIDRFLTEHRCNPKLDRYIFSCTYEKIKIFSRTDMISRRVREYKEKKLHIILIYNCFLREKTDIFNIRTYWGI